MQSTHGMETRMGGVRMARAGLGMWWLRACGWAMMACLAVVAGCSRNEPVYDQSTPEGTIAAARQMIEDGRAQQLPGLIYAENADMRRLLNTMGRLFQNTQELAKELQTRFPQETSALKARAEELAKQGKATTVIGQLAQQAQRRQGSRGTRRRGPPPTDERQQFDEAVTRLFIDPYGFIRESEGKLTTTYMTDDQVALLWDGKMVLPPLGMVMQRQEGRWYFVLPTNVPGVANFMPQTPEQYQIMGGLVAVFDKVVVDLRTEVQSGQLASLEAVSRRAGEMTFVPAVLTFVAYSRLRDAQKAPDAQNTTAGPAPAGGR